MSHCPQCGCAIVGAQDPSPAEARVLDFVLDHHSKFGRFPTYHAIKSGLRLRSIASVHHQVHALVAKGWLSIERNRGIKAARRPE